MPHMAVPEVPVYSHDPRKIIPLLVSYLPHSIPVLGSIIGSTPPPGSFYEKAHELPTPYLTFPPEGEEPPIWTCIVPLPSPQSDQIRCFCSLERRLKPLSASSSDQGPSLGEFGQELQELKNEAIAQVIGALLAYDKVNSGWSMVGSLNYEWEPSVREALGGTKRGLCSVWLPPSSLLNSPGEEEKREGWVVGQGRELDVLAYQHSSDIARSASYYRDRLFRSTVIWPTPATYQPPQTPLDIKGTIFEPSPSEMLPPPTDGEFPAAAMILTHLDGAIGALHTSPEYQRRGLARWVVQEHLRNGRGVLYPFPPRGAHHRTSTSSASNAAHPKDRVINEGPGVGRDGRCAWSCIFHGNVASESLFEGMGWSEEWSVAWVNKGVRQVPEIRRVFERALGEYQHPPEPTQKQQPEDATEEDDRST